MRIYNEELGLLHLVQTIELRQGLKLVFSVWPHLIMVSELNLTFLFSRGTKKANYGKYLDELVEFDKC